MLNKLIIIGSGAAGLTCALRCADYFDVLLVSKGQSLDGSTAYAQGGIAAPIGKEDSVMQHLNDTLSASDGLSSKEIAQEIIASATDTLAWLEKNAVNFCKNHNNELLLSKEGGHKKARVAFIKDQTGLYLGSALLQKAKEHPNITLLENHLAVDLIIDQKKCVGVYLCNQQNEIKAFNANAVVLATGGANALYLNTTSNYFAGGSGMAMAYRAGCRLADLEFTQFHPTCLYGSNKSLLLTEVLRGEGALLLLPNKTRFMQNYHDQAELAPRYIVAQAIHQEMQKHSLKHVWLDITHKSTSFLKNRFPNLYKECLNYGFDMAKELLPVVPAAHYSCGGVVAGNKGQTDISGLFAIGEVACTSFHGANRLASNSLLECCVVGIKSADFLKENFTKTKINTKKHAWTSKSSKYTCDFNLETNHLRAMMSENMSIIRDNKKITSMLTYITKQQAYISDICNNYNLNLNIIKYRNLLEIAKLTIESALFRQESRGSHVNKQFSKNHKLEGLHTTCQKNKSCLFFTKMPFFQNEA